MNRRLLLLCLGLVLAQPAGAQIVGRPFEFSGQAGFQHYDLRARMKDGPGYYGSAGWRAWPWLVLEGQLLFGPSHADTLPDKEHNFFSGGLDLRLNLRRADSPVVPFVLVGAGYASSHTSGHPDPKLERGSGSLGLGLLYNLRNQRTFVRFQVRDLFFRERQRPEFSNHFSASLGLHYVWRGRERDSDLDGVRDGLDRCASTPLGAKVDAHGCPLDTDGDKVFDGLDKCEGTPAGCQVDEDGCPGDADGDGVCDGLDQCADTPKGATVDARGCPSDPDGDGIMDGIDQCADTPAGCTVDEKGCPSDDDGDGVCDGLDMCPKTPAGVAVDAAGCPFEVSEQELELLDTGMIRLQDVRFDSGKATIQERSFPVLEKVALVLQQYPTLQIEIGGHTDNQGSPGLNQKLSGERAEAVLDHIKQNFPQITSSQFTAKGYGSSRPIAPNTTDLGRSRNRRVEFKVLNPAALLIERQRRTFLRKESAAPADTVRGAAPSPAPADTARGAAPSPAPADTARGAAPSAAPADTVRGAARSPAPADTTGP